MSILRTIHSSALAWTFGLTLILPAFPSASAEPTTTVPAVVQAGFALHAKGQPDLAVDLWRKGGLMQGEYRLPAQANYFKEAEMAIGGYRSFEVVQTKAIGRSSQILYVAINYERGAIYGRFLLYRTERDWVVQSMQFNTKPESVMPWLALEAGN